MYLVEYQTDDIKSYLLIKTMDEFIREFLYIPVGLYRLTESNRANRQQYLHFGTYFFFG